MYNIDPKVQQLKHNLSLYLVHITVQDPCGRLGLGLVKVD